MAVDIQQALGSRVSVELLNVLARAVPSGLAHPIVDIIADGIAVLRHARMVRAIRANQWVARGEALDKEALDQAVRQTLRNISWSLFVLYHHRKNPESAWRMVVLDAPMEQLTGRPAFSQGGLMLAGLHMSGFDLALQAACMGGFRPWVFTVPDPRGGYLAENEMRRKIGMTIVDPTSFDALRDTVRHLRRGGTVLTGIDRPVPAPGHRPQFFGRPASLSTFYIQLAIRAQVPVMVVTTNFLPDGRYHVVISGPIAMESYPDREMEVLRNAEKVLSVAEGIIRKVPEQWQMVNPVWPETLAQAPY
jgi:lauroyl/myristoyl acyltransferase